MGRDPHGRVHRADKDLRRRPADGFRTAGRSRFVVLTRDALALLPAPLRTAVRDAEVWILDVPPPAPNGRADVPLARYDSPGPGRRGRLEVYRRALELRVTRREQLTVLLRRSLERAIATGLGLATGEEDPDGG